MNDHLIRQLDIVPLKILNTPITIVGAGAIGGWTTLCLAKMGFEDIRVIDFDEVSIANMSSQFFRFKDIGKLKVDALTELVEEFTQTKIQTCQGRYPEGAAKDFISGILIVAVDSMEARKKIWEFSKGSTKLRAVIDPRMGAQSALLYVTHLGNPEECESYEKTFYSDGAAVQEPCTAKATCWTASMLSGLVCKAVVDMLTRKDYLRTAQWDIAQNDFVGVAAKI